MPEPGDLVEFDLCERARTRRANNPRLVQGDNFPSLPASLATQGRDAADPDDEGDGAAANLDAAIVSKAPHSECCGGATVVAFPRHDLSQPTEELRCCRQA